MIRLVNRFFEKVYVYYNFCFAQIKNKGIIMQTKCIIIVIMIILAVSFVNSEQNNKSLNQKINDSDEYVSLLKNLDVIKKIDEINQ